MKRNQQNTRKDKVRPMGHSHYATKIIEGRAPYSKFTPERMKLIAKQHETINPNDPMGV